MSLVFFYLSNHLQKCYKLIWKNILFSCRVESVLQKVAKPFFIVTLEQVTSVMQKNVELVMIRDGKLSDLEARAGRMLGEHTFREVAIRVRHTHNEKRDPGELHRLHCAIFGDQV